MTPSYKLIKQIKRTAGGRVSEKDLQRSLAMLQAETPIGALMSTLAVREFRETMVDAGRSRPRPEILAWMTIAAAGPRRARGALVSRAVQIVAPHTLIDALLASGDFARDCATQAEGAPSEEEWGAWLLLGRMHRHEVRGVAKAQPTLRRRLQKARRRSINPKLSGQLRELGLV